MHIIFTLTALIFKTVFVDKNSKPFFLGGGGGGSKMASSVSRWK
jgi:hypothetical protein